MSSKDCVRDTKKKIKSTGRKKGGGQVDYFIDQGFVDKRVWVDCDENILSVECFGLLKPCAAYFLVNEELRGFK